MTKCNIVKHRENILTTLIDNIFIYKLLFFIIKWQNPPKNPTKPAYFSDYDIENHDHLSILNHFNTL